MTFTRSYGTTAPRTRSDVPLHARRRTSTVSAVRCAALGDRDPEHPELLLAPAEAEAEDEPSTARADRRPPRPPRGGAGRGSGVRTMPVPSRDPLGHGRERREHRQERGEVAVGGAVVLAHPRGVEPERLGEAHELERLPVLLLERPSGPRRDLPGEQADADQHAHVEHNLREGGWPRRPECMHGSVRIALDPTSPIPPSVQVRRAIAGRIVRGSLLPGIRIPTVRELAGRLGLAPNTVAKAYRELEADGLLDRTGTAGDLRGRAAADGTLGRGDASDGGGGCLRQASPSAGSYRRGRAPGRAARTARAR